MGVPAWAWAQEADDDAAHEVGEEGDSQTSTEPSAGQSTDSSGLPIVQGRVEAVGILTPRGMVFELTNANGARLEVPPDLPVGSSRRAVFAFTWRRPEDAEIAPGFRRFGEAMKFDGAIDATRAPVRVSMRARRSPARPNEKLVLAVERASMCTPENSTPIPNGPSGFCSSWVLIDARHEDNQLVAEVAAPGGYRLVFGTVPATTPASSGPLMSPDDDPLGGL